MSLCVSKLKLYSSCLMPSEVRFIF